MANKESQPGASDTEEQTLKLVTQLHDIVGNLGFSLDECKYLARHRTNDVKGFLAGSIDLQVLRQDLKQDWCDRYPVYNGKRYAGLYPDY